MLIKRKECGAHDRLFFDKIEYKIMTVTTNIR